MNKTIAKEIHRLNKEIEKHMDIVQSNINNAQQKALRISDYLQDIKKSKRCGWVEQYLTLPWEKIKNYLAIANTAKKRVNSIDRRFFMLMGIIKKNTRTKRRVSSKPKWVTWSNKLNVFVKDMQNKYERGEITKQELDTVMCQIELKDNHR